MGNKLSYNSTFNWNTLTHYAVSYTHVHKPTTQNTLYYHY
jgi:hypothetical protein